MTFIVNFHGIGYAERPYEYGEEPYWIGVERFCAFLDVIENATHPVAITFDDGNASDWRIAVPELQRRGMRATFFVLAGKLDQPGYLTSEQVCKIAADPLFKIGSHGMDHRPWPELNGEAFMRETLLSQQILAKLCGHEITAAGLPFGRYDRSTLARLKSQGYEKIYSSDGSPRLIDANPLPRFSVRADTAHGDLVAEILRSKSLASRFKREVTVCIKRLY